jgi:hypothetical protein
LTDICRPSVEDFTFHFVDQNRKEINLCEDGKMSFGICIVGSRADANTSTTYYIRFLGDLDLYRTLLFGSHEEMRDGSYRVYSFSDGVIYRYEPVASYDKYVEVMKFLYASLPQHLEPDNDPGGEEIVEFKDITRTKLLTSFDLALDTNDTVGV